MLGELDRMKSESTSLVDFIAEKKSQGASEKEIRKNFNRYLEMISRKNAVPLHGSFELTPLCNLKCKMCYVSLGKEAFSSKQLISVKKWKKLNYQKNKSKIKLKK